MLLATGKNMRSLKVLTDLRIRKSASLVAPDSEIRRSGKNKKIEGRGILHVDAHFPSLLPGMFPMLFYNRCSPSSEILIIRRLYKSPTAFLNTFLLTPNVA